MIIYSNHVCHVLFMRCLSSIPMARKIMRMGMAPLFLMCLFKMSKMSMNPSPSPCLMHSSFSWHVWLMLKGLQPAESNSLMQMIDSSCSLVSSDDFCLYTPKKMKLNSPTSTTMSNMSQYSMWKLLSAGSVWKVILCTDLEGIDFNY